MNLVKDMVSNNIIEQKNEVNSLCPTIVVRKKKNQKTSPECDNFVPGELISDADQKAKYGFNLCLVNDLRETNRSTVPIRSHILPVNDMFSTLSNKSIVNIFDQTKAFWSIPLDENSKKSFGFMLRGSHTFRWARCPMGFLNSSAHLSQCYQEIFKKYPNILFYSDNLIVTSENESNHLKDLEWFFSIIQDHSIKLSLYRADI
jgi:hypothetical protein